MTTIIAALVGNPNCGKTTLFNALTGAKQKVGNWPGVTIECKRGEFVEKDYQVELTDLPGTYSLAITESGAVDTALASHFIFSHDIDVVLNIVDASLLERSLYLTMQLLERKTPVVVALNMMDVARARGIHIDVEKLSAHLGCPVVALEAHRRRGLLALKEAMVKLSDQHDASASRQCKPANLATVELRSASSEFAITDLSEDAALAPSRYRLIQQILAACVEQKPRPKVTRSVYLDRFVLNRLFGIPIFLCVMYALFACAMLGGGVLQPYFDSASEAIFVGGLSTVLSYCHAPLWCIMLFANGLGRGMNTMITLIPVIGTLFLFLTALEDSGYMARAAFVVDRMMGFLGLPGKALIPMIVGFGCNVPAVMSARTLEYERDRLLTILMMPFMSCSARLTIYAIFAAAFFRQGGQNIIFALYLIGIAMAMLTGFLLRKTYLRGEASPLIMVLPAYHVPRIKTLLLNTWQRLYGFIFRAGKVIVPVCVFIEVLNMVSIDGTIQVAGGVHSVLSTFGQWITPIFSPMGIEATNWPATVGLITGVLAKEVVLGTLNTLYAGMGHLSYSGMTNMLAQQFDGAIGAFAYLLFVLLYFPCISTMAAMLREMHRGWTIFSAVWMMGIAYGAAVTFYQAATFFRHPGSSVLWIVAMIVVFMSVIVAMRLLASRQDVLRLASKLTERPLSLCDVRCFKCPMRVAGKS